MQARILALSAAVILSGQAAAQMTPQAVEALKKPVEVERAQPLSSVPITKHMGKLAIDATLNGVTREFVFDTGSPTMISRELADELDLKVIGSNTGRDANGREVTTQIAIVERLEIGAVTVRNTPVLIADFSVSDPQGCFIQHGLIGSEIFPGSVWGIDLEAMRLHIAERLEDLATLDLAKPSVAAPLNDWGYPHAPVVPYSIGKFRDNALFDTGHSARVVLFNRVLESEAVKRALDTQSLRKGRGSLGVSAAGLGAETDLLRFEIEGMRVGEGALGRTSATIRTAPPSLIGLGVLDTHSVTLDYPGKRFLLHPRGEQKLTKEWPGFALMAAETGVRVMQLYEGSAAERAGLKLGDQVVAIGDRELPTGEASCEVKKWLIEERPTASAKGLTVLREGARVEIDISE